MAMAKAMLDGVTLGYVEVGAGPPVVLAHVAQPDPRAQPALSHHRL